MSRSTQALRRLYTRSLVWSGISWRRRVGCASLGTLSSRRRRTSCRLGRALSPPRYSELTSISLSRSIRRRSRPYAWP